MTAWGSEYVQKVVTRIARTRRRHEIMLLHGGGPSCGRAGGNTHGQDLSPPGNRSAVPFKHHAEHRHHIPKPRYRVTNWAEYDAALKRRGSYLPPDFYSGATGQSGRFSEGFSLRRLHPMSTHGISPHSALRPNFPTPCQSAHRPRLRRFRCCS